MTAELREQFSETLKKAMREKNTPAVSTLRLILASIKDRDIAARARGDGEEQITKDEILALLQTMIRQRQESIVAYESNKRAAQAEQERLEIIVIERFLPKQMNEKQIKEAIEHIVREKKVSGLKGMSCVMSELRKRHPGEVDFALAGKISKATLLASANGQ